MLGALVSVVNIKVVDTASHTLQLLCLIKCGLKSIQACFLSLFSLADQTSSLCFLFLNLLRSFLGSFRVRLLNLFFLRCWSRSFTTFGFWVDGNILLCFLTFFFQSLF